MSIVSDAVNCADALGGGIVGAVGGAIIGIAGVGGWFARYSATGDFIFTTFKFCSGFQTIGNLGLEFLLLCLSLSLNVFIYNKYCLGCLNPS